ncbi:MAG: ParB N-terminal domain-containing protein [Candidatus Competibacter denitrificans]|jgi:ParB family chromosome partitioning protein
MTEQIELDRLYMSRFRPTQRPLAWPSPGEVAHTRKTGLIEPVIVRPLPGDPPPNYEILFGLKRWLLAQRLHLTTVPVDIRAVDDETARCWVEADGGDPSVENPLTLARAIQRRVAEGLKVAAAGREFGLSRTDASHRLRLLRLAPDVLEHVATGDLAPSTARVLVGLKPNQQRAMVERIQREGLSTRQVEAFTKAWRTDRDKQALAAEITSSVGDDPDRQRLEWVLSEQLGTPVAVRYDASGGGQLVIDFADLDVLEGVLERLGYRFEG